MSLNTRLTSYGSATAIPVVAVDPEGKIRGVTEETIDPAAVLGYTPEDPTDLSRPKWRKITLTIAEVEVEEAPVKYWFVDGVQDDAVADAAATQDIVLATLPAKAAVLAVRVKTDTPGGESVDTGVLGLALTDLTLITEYDILSAAADDNFDDVVVSALSGTHAADDLVATVDVTGSGKNCDDLDAGLAVDVWILYGVLP